MPRIEDGEHEQEEHNIHEVTTNGLATATSEQKSKSERNAAKAAGNMIANNSS